MTSWIITPAFCKSKMLEGCLKHIYKTPPQGKFRHVILDNRYPIDQHENSKRIREIAKDYGCNYFDTGKDMGLHKSLNNAILLLRVLPTDQFIGCDPDDRPTPGWADALKACMLEDSRLAVLGLSFWVIKQRIAEGVPFQERTIAGHKVLIHPGLEMFNVAAFNTKFIFDIGGFYQPNEYYGGIESYLHQQWMRRGMYYGYLADYVSDADQVDRDDPTLHDPEYRQWKTDHVAGYKGGLEQWMRDKKK